MIFNELRQHDKTITLQIQLGAVHTFVARITLQNYHVADSSWSATSVCGPDKPNVYTAADTSSNVTAFDMTISVTGLKV